MTYLDISPMIGSLRTQAPDFEVDRGGWLHHMPSRHRFRFDTQGRVWLEAQCDCSTRSVSAEQGKELIAAFRNWENGYWRPTVINREFASHFEPVQGFRRFMLDVRIAWRRYRRSKAHRTATEPGPAIGAEDGLPA
jgi:hypothetical protein